MDVSCLIGAQKCHDGGDVGRLSEAPEKAVNGERAQMVGQQRFMDMTFQDPAQAVATMEGERETYEALLEIVGDIGED